MLPLIVASEIYVILYLRPQRRRGRYRNITNTQVHEDSVGQQYIRPSMAGVAEAVKNSRSINERELLVYALKLYLK